MTRKSKSLHSITIERYTFITRLYCNTNTDHISVSTSHQYQDFNKVKEYRKQYYLNTRDPNTTIMGSDKHRIKCSCAKQGIDIEDFDGFTQDQKYCYKFNKACRKLNRNKYNNKCFICDKDETENGQRLSVHHINMDKLQGCNNKQWKLIPLCQSCHNRVHNNLWKNRLEYLLNDEKESL